MSIYHFVFKHGLTKTDPEFAHHATVWALNLAHRIPGGPLALRTLFARGAGAGRTVMGMRFKTPLGMGAGFDKDAEIPLALLDMGYGFVEVGTVTPRPQPGNPAPRAFRLVPDKALINRMGFNNGGADAMAARLAKVRAKKRGGDAVIGVNIGKNKTTELADAVDDYRYCARTLAPYASYLAVNVSSPNTPKLRELQTVQALRPILRAVQEEAAKVIGPHGNPVPVLVKIAPDLHDDDIVELCELVREIGLDGVIATNTTIERPRDLLTDPAKVEAAGAGGLSGPMLAPRSREVLALLRRELPAETCVMSVGGIFTADEARARLDAGADLVQGFTAMIYEGPAWPGRIARQLLG
ncbi:quinone-dependent dihydroorotate dehydrogenase [Dermabacteraceae bacterium P13264]